jgi:hypothetical protein
MLSTVLCNNANYKVAFVESLISKPRHQSHKAAALVAYLLHFYMRRAQTMTTAESFAKP